MLKQTSSSIEVSSQRCAGLRACFRHRSSGIAGYVVRILKGARLGRFANKVDIGVVAAPQWLINTRPDFVQRKYGLTLRTVDGRSNRRRFSCFGLILIRRIY